MRVSLDLSVTNDGRYGGPYPVMVAIFGPVLDDPAPDMTGFDRGPQIGKSPGGHVGVAHPVEIKSKVVYGRSVA